MLTSHDDQLIIVRAAGIAGATVLPTVAAAISRCRSSS
jgi:hypothetical protein